MTPADKIAAMKAWYAAHPLSDDPITLDPGEVISEPAKYLAAQLGVIDMCASHREGSPKQRMFILSWMRLYKLKQYIESCPKNN